MKKTGDSKTQVQVINASFWDAFSRYRRKSICILCTYIILIELKTASRLLWPVFLKNVFRYFSIYWGRTDWVNVLKLFIHVLHIISSKETAPLTESVIPINLTVNQSDLVTLSCLTTRSLAPNVSLYKKNRESSMQSNKIHLRHAVTRRYFLSWAPFSPQSATVNILAWSERLNFSFQVSRWPLHITHRWLRQA